MLAVQRTPFSLTPWKPSSATNGRYLCHLGTPMLPVTNAPRFRNGGGPWTNCCWRAISALMLGGVILSLAASPPVATRIGLDPFHFFSRHVLFLLPSFIVLIGVSFLSPKQIRRAARYWCSRSRSR